MTIRWITPLLGTTSATTVRDEHNLFVLDVRNLVDKFGNSITEIQNIVDEGVCSLSRGEKTVVCCDYGISRSNAIAAGIIAKFEKISFNQAVHRVQKETGEMEIKLQPLDAVRQALGEKSPQKSLGSPNSVLITGGSGFLGTALTFALKNICNVISPRREEIDVELGSTELDLLVGERDIDCIVHLANPKVYSSNLALGQSLTMLRNVAEVCITRNIKLVYPSGWEVYSGYSGELLVNELTPQLPKGAYGEAKHLGEFLIGHWRKMDGLNCLLLRSGPVYGVNSDKPKFIQNFIEKARRSDTIITHRYQNGDPKLDLMHIDDYISVLKKAMFSDKVGDFNVGTGKLTSTSDVAKLITEKLNSNSNIEQNIISTNTASIAMDWRLAGDTFDWNPSIDLDTALSSILASP